jgi:hypothetical protein
METLAQKVELFKCTELVKLLIQCTDRQIEFFHKIYPKGAAFMDKKDLDNAYDLCQRTIIKNNKTPQP